jgi:hypothetical protein
MTQSREVKPPVNNPAVEQRLRQVLADASTLTKLRARLFIRRLDLQVAAGVPAPVGSALAVHTARLTSTREREQLARALRACVRDARSGRATLSSRIPVHRAGVVAAEDLIDDVTVVLHSPRPVRARGMARLRLLLSDGAGPLYRPGSGSLIAELRGVLAAL